MHSTLTSTPWARSSPSPRSTLSEVGPPRLSTRYAVVDVRRSVDADADQEPVVRRGARTTRRSAGSRWSGWCAAAAGPGRRTDSAVSTARRKKSTPIRVGSPPCQATVTSPSGWDPMYWRRYSPSRSSDIRKRSPGRATPSTGRSSTRSRDCRWARSAWPARGTGPAWCWSPPVRSSPRIPAWSWSGRRGRRLHRRSPASRCRSSTGTGRPRPEDGRDVIGRVRTMGHRRSSPVVRTVDRCPSHPPRLHGTGPMGQTSDETTYP